ncbi:LOG family protein [Companilactobacillus hulinensis]|uniref:LOG family protein n=1 Tax=Companilactobacillus hulinensis TaxID=2486007 RepID=UPI000F767E5F|nr:TIGR00730 family Rossman fold protein [Companilactobacillus hulinensis]
MKNIAVYCGAAAGNKPIFKDSAIKLGQWIVDNNYGLTYGGGVYGLMGVIADSVLEQNGYVHGIITKQLNDRKLAHPNLSKLDIVETMDIRKREMLNNSIASIALPGGPGTLEEISEAFSWAKIGDNDNPCIFYNIDHYYDSLMEFFDNMVENGFLEPSGRKKVLFSDSLPEIKNFIDSYTPPELRHYK